jgi:hypothetical protein
LKERGGYEPDVNRGVRPQVSYARMAEKVVPMSSAIKGWPSDKTLAVIHNPCNKRGQPGK